MNSKEFNEVVYQIKRRKLAAALLKSAEELKELDKQYSLRKKNQEDC